MTTATSTARYCLNCDRPATLFCVQAHDTRPIERDDDDGLEMHDNSCGECGHPYKPGDETHYPECSRLAN